MTSRKAANLRQVFASAVCCALAATVVAGLAPSAEGPVKAEESAAAAAALVAAVDRNVEVAQDWLDSKDYKSVGKAAGGLLVLAEAVRRKSDGKEWLKAADGVKALARSLNAAAQKQDPAQCQKVLGEFADVSKALAAASSSVADNPPKRTPRFTGTMRGAMDLMEGTFADAKMAVSLRKPENAKRYAIVLAELADLMSNYRPEPAWKQEMAELESAAAEVGRSPDTEPAAVRALLRGVYQKCDKCHQRMNNRPAAGQM
jgi:hypothetical protein